LLLLGEPVIRDPKDWWDIRLTNGLMERILGVSLESAIEIAGI